MLLLVLFFFLPEAVHLHEEKSFQQPMMVSLENTFVFSIQHRHLNLCSLPNYLGHVHYAMVPNSC